MSPFARPAILSTEAEMALIFVSIPMNGLKEFIAAGILIPRLSIIDRPSASHVDVIEKQAEIPQTWRKVESNNEPSSVLSARPNAKTTRFFTFDIAIIGMEVASIVKLSTLP
jgi:hypothetical protein